MKAKVLAIASFRNWAFLYSMLEIEGCVVADLAAEISLSEPVFKSDLMLMTLNLWDRSLKLGSSSSFPANGDSFPALILFLDPCNGERPPDFSSPSESSFNRLVKDILSPLPSYCCRVLNRADVLDQQYNSIVCFYLIQSFSSCCLSSSTIVFMIIFGKIQSFGC